MHPRQKGSGHHPFSSYWYAHIWAYLDTVIYGSIHRPSQFWPIKLASCFLHSKIAERIIACNYPTKSECSRSLSIILQHLCLLCCTHHFPLSIFARLLCLPQVWQISERLQREFKAVCCKESKTDYLLSRNPLIANSQRLISRTPQRNLLFCTVPNRGPASNSKARRFFAQKTKFSANDLPG